MFVFHVFLTMYCRSTLGNLFLGFYFGLEPQRGNKANVEVFQAVVPICCMVSLHR